MSDRKPPQARPGTEPLVPLGDDTPNRRPVVEPLFRTDKTVHSVPPGGAKPERYSRNLVAELFAERYAAGDARRQAEEDAADAARKETRVVLARKASIGPVGDDGDGEGRGGQGGDGDFSMRAESSPAPVRSNPTKQGSGLLDL